MRHAAIRSRPNSLAIALTMALAASPAAAQRGERSVEEWTRILGADQRVESLRIDEVIAAVGFRPGDVVADIGAGVGVFSIPIADALGSGGTVLAVEVDAGFLPAILERAAAAGVSNVYPVLGRFQDPLLPRRDVDVAFFHDVLHHVGDRGAYLLRLATYMKPGSRLVLIDHNTFPSREAIPMNGMGASMAMLRADVDGWMSAAGFAVEREIELFDDKVFIVYRRGG